VINVTPRYAKLLDSKGEVFGWENFELISGRAGSKTQCAAAAAACKRYAVRLCRQLQLAMLRW
jgi:hypothetical protein